MIEISFPFLFADYEAFTIFAPCLFAKQKLIFILIEVSYLKQLTLWQHVFVCKDTVKKEKQFST